MTYNNVLVHLILRFPETVERMNAEDVDSGLYVVFGFSINGHIIELLRNAPQNNQKLKQWFAFFEEMATAYDEEVRELLTYSTLERLGDDKEILRTAYEYMGKETRLQSDLVESFLGRPRIDCT